MTNVGLSENSEENPVNPLFNHHFCSARPRLVPGSPGNLTSSACCGAFAAWGSWTVWFYLHEMPQQKIPQNAWFIIISPKIFVFFQLIKTSLVSCTKEHHCSPLAGWAKPLLHLRGKWHTRSTCERCRWLCPTMGDSPLISGDLNLNGEHWVSDPVGISTRVPLFSDRPKRESGVKLQPFDSSGFPGV